MFKGVRAAFGNQGGYFSGGSHSSLLAPRQLLRAPKKINSSLTIMQRDRNVRVNYEANIP